MKTNKKSTPCHVCGTVTGSCSADVHAAYELQLVNRVHAAYEFETTVARKRKAYAKALTAGITLEEAQATVARIIEETNIRGCKPSYSVGLDREYERGWGIGCRLNVAFDRVYDDRVVNPDEPLEAVEIYRIRIDVSWSSTTRDVAAARAAIKLYTEVTDLAAELQAVLTERPIRSFADWKKKDENVA